MIVPAKIRHPEPLPDWFKVVATGSFLTMNDVLSLFNLSRAELYREILEKTFPSPDFNPGPLIGFNSNGNRRTHYCHSNGKAKRPHWSKGLLMKEIQRRKLESNRSTLTGGQ